MLFDEELRTYLESLTGQSPPPDRPFTTAIETYALEIHLVRRRSGSPSREVTPLGDVFLRLRGKDAVQWLLTVEVAQNMGTSDPWRVSPKALAEALTPRGIRLEHDAGTLFFQYADEALDRMGQLGAFATVVDNPDDNTPLEYMVNDAMRDVVAAVLQPSPWRAAVEAMLADERAVVIPGFHSGTVDATIAQTRLIAHEIRNALVPVRIRLDSLLDPDDDTSPRPQIEGARRGVVRVLAFVDEMLATSELMTEVATPRDLGAIVRDAISQTDDGERVELVEPAESLRVAVPRSRLILAIANVVRNALQADPTKKVRVAVSRREQTARVQVDDAGPGVPPGDRLRIFDDGFTTRSGGSGYGLAYVKRTVETILNARVWCETSDLGGARFVIEFPLDPAS